MVETRHQKKQRLEETSAPAPAPGATAHHEEAAHALADPPRAASVKSGEGCRMVALAAGAADEPAQLDFDAFLNGAFAAVDEEGFAELDEDEKLRLKGALTNLAIKQKNHFVDYKKTGDLVAPLKEDCGVPDRTAKTGERLIFKALGRSDSSDATP
mmetsp:Transcript_9303/g.28497  ORF Transcript_9303/g.28497 Transcript_9303/m.28497 type:complete len:156 (+) Transcript_9303:3-470(+)